MSAGGSFYFRSFYRSIQIVPGAFSDTCRFVHHYRCRLVHFELRLDLVVHRGALRGRNSKCTCVPRGRPGSRHACACPRGSGLRSPRVRGKGRATSAGCLVLSCSSSCPTLHLSCEFADPVVSVSVVHGRCGGHGLECSTKSLDDLLPRFLVELVFVFGSWRCAVVGAR